LLALPPDARDVVHLREPLIMVSFPGRGPTLPEDAALAARTFVSGVAELAIPAGARLTFAAADFTPESRAFRVAEVRRRGDYTRVFALGPFGARVSEPASLSIALGSGFAVAQKFEIWTLEDDVSSGRAGRYVRQADAAVGADGVHVNVPTTRLTYLALKEIP
jgi:hypothetical protein